jgi:hypothetical protein
MSREGPAVMPSDNVGKKRLVGNDSEIPAELANREAQDRPKGAGAESPVDSMHVDAPKEQKNSQGRRRNLRAPKK